MLNSGGIRSCVLIGSLAWSGYIVESVHVATGNPQAAMAAFAVARHYDMPCWQLEHVAKSLEPALVNAAEHYSIFMGIDDVLSAKRFDFPSSDIQTPFEKKTTVDLVQSGIEHEAPFELTWSCNRSNDVPCGRCVPCWDRSYAFNYWRIDDPTAA